MKASKSQFPNPQNPNRNLNNLPDEILLHILTFVPIQHAVTTSLISRRWHSLWSHFPYDLVDAPQPHASNTRRLLDIVDRFILLRSTSLDNLGDSFPKEFMLGNLIFLKLQTAYTELDLIGMAELLKLCPNLETLVLDYPLYRKAYRSSREEISEEPVSLNIPRLKEVKLLNVFHLSYLEYIDLAKWIVLDLTYIFY